MERGAIYSWGHGSFVGGGGSPPGNIAGYVPELNNAISLIPSL